MTGEEDGIAVGSGDDGGRNNALGEEEFVPQQTEAVRAANFEKVRKGENGGMRGRRDS